VRPGATQTVAAAAAALAIALAAPAALAALEAADQAVKTVGATTIRWSASFRDLGYQNGATLTIDVTWHVEGGAASFKNFRQRQPHFTPKGPDPAAGALMGAQLAQNSGAAATSGNVQATLRFTELHCDAQRAREIGNAHFALELDVDRNGDGIADGVVAYGVNVHAEHPGLCAAVRGAAPRGR